MMKQTRVSKTKKLCAPQCIPLFVHSRLANPDWQGDCGQRAEYTVVRITSSSSKLWSASSSSLMFTKRTSSSRSLLRFSLSLCESSSCECEPLPGCSTSTSLRKDPRLICTLVSSANPRVSQASPTHGDGQKQRTAPSGRIVRAPLLGRQRPPFKQSGHGLPSCRVLASKHGLSKTT